MAASTGEVVGKHQCRFSRGQTAHRPWHYVPVLARKASRARCGDGLDDEAG